MNHIVGLVSSRETVRRRLQGAAFWALWAFVFSITLEKALWVPGLGTGARLLGLGAGMLGILATAWSWPMQLQPLRNAHWIMLALLGWSSLTFFWSVAPEKTVIQMRTMLQLVVFVWLIWQIAEPRRRHLSLMRAYVWGAGIVAVVIVGNYVFDNPLSGLGGTARYSAFGADPNRLGCLLALTVPMSCYLCALASHPAPTWLYRLHFAVSSWALLLTASRGAVVVGVVAAIYIPFAFAQSTRRRKTAEILVRFVFLLCLPLLTPKSIPVRVTHWPASQLEVGDPHARLTIWANGLEIWKKNPIVGYGAGTFVYAIESRIERKTGAHNAFLEILVGQGLIGFSLFASVVGALVLAVLCMSSGDRLLWICLVLCWLVAAMLLSWEHAKVTWFLFGLAFAWPSDTRRST